jgi:hypothetical protein
VVVVTGKIFGTWRPEKRGRNANSYKGIFGGKINQKSP